jgi:hypothetical protein
LTGRERFREAIAGRGAAFAPILWEQLPELVRQPQDAWWRDPTVARRLLADAAALALADAMFVCVGADEVVGSGVPLARAGGLFGRPVLGVCGEQGWVDGGGELVVLSADGSWPDGPGVVITPGDVSGRWSAEQLHAVGSARR